MPLIPLSIPTTPPDATTPPPHPRRHHSQTGLTIYVFIYLLIYSTVIDNRLNFCFLHELRRRGFFILDDGAAFPASAKRHRAAFANHFERGGLLDNTHTHTHTHTHYFLLGSSWSPPWSPPRSCEWSSTRSTGHMHSWRTWRGRRCSRRPGSRGTPAWRWACKENK